jgi:hypothetical protein
MVTANNLLFIASYPLSIMLVDLNKPLDIVTIDLPKPAPEKGNPARETPVIAELFVDPTARHLIATTNLGDAFYLPISPGNPAVQSRRPRPLRVRQTITAVAWSPLSTPAGDQGKDAVTPPATDVLIGTANGQVLSLPLPPQDDIFKSVSISMSKPLERDLQTVYTLLDQAPVMGIAFGFWPEERKRRAWVVITTKDRVYEVQGAVNTAQPGKGAAWAEEAFKPVREAAPSRLTVWRPRCGADSQNSKSYREIPHSPTYVYTCRPRPVNHPPAFQHLHISLGSRDQVYTRHHSPLHPCPRSYNVPP